MKLLNHICYIIALAAGAASASASESPAGWYIAGTGLVNFLHSSSDGAADLKRGRGGSLVLGYYLRDRMRVEAELGSQQNSYKDSPVIYYLLPYGKITGGTFKRNFAMANVVLDCPLSEHWDLNFGAGVGMMRLSGRISHDFVIAIFPPPPDTSGYHDVDRLAGQITAGFTYHLTPRFALTAGYRLLEAEKASHQGTRINTGVFSSAEFGLRFKL